MGEDGAWQAGGDSEQGREGAMGLNLDRRQTVLPNGVLAFIRPRLLVLSPLSAKKAPVLPVTWLLFKRPGRVSA